MILKRDREYNNTKRQRSEDEKIFSYHQKSEGDEKKETLLYVLKEQSTATTS